MRQGSQTSPLAWGKQRGGHRPDVEEERKVLRRLARCQRQPSTPRLRHSQRSRSLRRSPANRPRSRATPKRIDSTATIAQAAEEYARAQKHNPNTRAALYSLVAANAGKLPSQLTRRRSPSRREFVAREVRATHPLHLLEVSSPLHPLARTDRRSTPHALRRCPQNSPARGQVNHRHRRRTPPTARRR